MIALLVGPVHGGKTTTAAEIISAVRKAGLRVGGILCPGTIEGGIRLSIDVEDLATGTRSPLADPQKPGAERVGKFSLLNEGLEFGRQALRGALQSRPDLLVIDEIGSLELDGRGWAEETSQLIEAYRASARAALLLVLRERFLDRARERWQLAAGPVVRVGDEEAASSILGMIRARQGRPTTVPDPGV